MFRRYLTILAACGILLGGAVPSAMARPAAIDHLGSCHGVGVMTNDGACEGGCGGVTVIVGADVSCEGADGEAPGQAGGNGCEGTTVIVTGNANCKGGDGADGNPGGSGGTGCTSTTLVVVGNSNCHGGNGGNGTAAGDPPRFVLRDACAAKVSCMPRVVVAR